MPADLTDFKSVLLPMIRKVVPALIAQEIVGVQPMMAPVAEPTEIGYSEPYFWVKPSGIISIWANVVSRNASILEWCIQTYGPQEDWTVTDRRWFGSDRKFYFKNEKDRTLFLLKWGDDA